MRVPRFFVASAALVAFFFVGGCASTASSTGNGGGGGESVTISAIACAKTQQVGVASYQCSATPSSGELTWSSSDQTVETIDATSGVAIPNATKTGTVTITATSTKEPAVAVTQQVNVANQIVYHQMRDGGLPPQIWVVNVDTKATTQIQAAGVNADGYDPNYFSDHQRIAFVPNDLPNNASDEIEIVATDGTVDGVPTAPIILTFSNLGNIDMPMPSPDGTSLAFIAQDATSKLQGIYAVTINGGTPQRLYQGRTTGGIGLGQPMWSHDGKHVVYNQASGAYSDIWTMGANGVNPSQITYTVGTSYTGANGVFAEGDQTIFYNLCTTGTTDCEIYSIAVDNTDQNNLGTLVTNAGLGPVVSPNGQFITFNYGGIAIYDIVNQTLVQVLTSGGGMDHPSW